jgi:hypothetical protein
VRRFVFRLLLFTLLVLALIAAVIRPYRPNRELFWAATVSKHRWLAAAPSPRLIFVGGSNLAFSLDSQRVAAALPAYTPVNMGLDAALGLGFLLREIEPDLRPGDVVVLSPEYEEFLGWRSGQVFSLARVLEQRPANAAFLGPENVAVLLDRGFGFFHWVFVNSRRRLDRQRIGGPYGIATFNPWGDAVLHLDLRPRGAKLPRTLAQVWRGGRLDSGALAVLDRFDARCARREVRVFLTHPPLPDDLNAGASPIVDVERAIYRRTTISVLDRPEEMFFPLDEFFDTEYHLLRAGRAQRTERLVERLAARLVVAAPEPKGGRP